ncbi:cation transporting ATPase C-terminal domain-containing protein [Saccharopolyspora spinosa]|uniref:cation transporting ATPase C-terminal domain-containing protein n=1 Tax=Saccharopolyspora spinosa TaxID=60894 RepID=UPI0011D2835A
MLFGSDPTCLAVSRSSVRRLCYRWYSAERRARARGNNRSLFSRKRQLLVCRRVEQRGEAVGVADQLAGHREDGCAAVSRSLAAICAWILGRATGTLRQANTVALVALVAVQLGQTLVVRGRTPLVMACALVSFVALAAVVQTPGLSQFFGASPLFRHGWMIAAGATTAATAISLLLQQW